MRTIIVDCGDVRAIAQANGRAKASIVVQSLAGDGGPVDLAADEINVVADAARRDLVERLPESLRDDATSALLSLSTQVVAERAKAPHAASRPPEEDPEIDPSVVVPPAFSDDALALAFTAQYAEELRYTAEMTVWHRWTGAHWNKERTLAVMDAARVVCREAAARCAEPDTKKKIASASTVAAVERLAKTDRAHAAVVEQWDRDPWLLNTPVGVVDLHTGSMRPARPDDYCTKTTAVAPGGDCPRWRRHLERVTGGDAALESYLGRLFGYALTGSIREHALAFVYGTGRNGKGVTINTVTGILQDYATVSPIETFTASHTDRHPTELAMLRGARLVTSQETEEGRRWAESRIKALTGGDPVSARFMRGDFFTFEPTFKLIIAGNHKPALRSVDEAIRRRFHLVPFSQTIPPHQVDPDLPEKLRAEWPGIMAWMIDGCLEWQEGGLRPPAQVLDATAEYFEAEDAVQVWLDECCTVRSSHEATAADLFASWKAWADAAGEYPGTQKRLSEALVARGFERARSGHSRTRGFLGLSVKTDSRTSYRAA